MSRLTDEIYEWDTRRVVEWLREVSELIYGLGGTS